MKNYFQGTKENPHHLSIGALVRNADGEICCHYFKTFSHPSLGTFEDFYILMRETIEPNETIEQCLARGLREELGIEATLKSFLGPIVSHFPIAGSDKSIEKTTLYFLCDLVSSGSIERKSNDPESKSEIRWMAPAELISKMKEQATRLNREDIDESEILRRLSL